MLNKRFMKIVAFILCFFTTAYLLPLDAMAYELNETLVDARLLEEEVSTSEPIEYEHQAEVVMEIEASRDEFQKEYLLDNSQRMFVIYPTAVHYEEDGQWREIDNTLKTATMDGEAVYTNTAGAWEVILPQSIGPDKAISVMKDGYTLSMTFLGKGTLPFESSELESLSISEQTLESIRINSSEAEIQNNISIFSEDDNAQLSQISSDKLGSAITYSDIFTDVDLRYDLISNYLKESIIVNTEPANEETYSYLLSAENMELVLQEDRSIYAYAEGETEEDEVIFYMPAPYMTDDNSRASFDIEVTLEETPDGYILTYTPSYEWMTEDDREYPIIIDPVVKPDITKANTSDQTVFSTSSMDSSWGMVECGYYSTTGIARTYIKYENLPPLTSSDMIINANMSMYKLETSSYQAYIDVHKVNAGWSAETITWSNKPAYNTTIEDFQSVLAAGWYNWDVTDIAKGWYEGENNGMMFKAQDSVENGGSNNFKQFCSSDFGGVYMPVLTITYINNNGLEDYWDYTSHSAGRAGTGYINNYTGNLVWVTDGLGFSGTRMPVSISHIYNANDKSNNDFGMGYGWRTNFNQTVKQWETDGAYYVWDDEDGTKHYFKNTSSGTYEDELGTGLVLTMTGSGTTKYCITDKDNNKMYFDSYGRLSQISNYQATVSSITITYTDNTYKRISTITDGAGRVYEFSYPNNILSSITFKGTGASPVSSMSYSYSSSQLTQITYPDTKYVTFGYTTNHLLNKITDVDGYYLTYDYNTTSSTQPNRVTKVQAYDGSAAGGTVNIAYGHNQTSFVDHNENEQIYQFNDWGNTVSVQDGQGRAQFAAYATDDPEVDINKANQMTRSSKLQNTVSNLARNTSFESNGYWTTDSSNATTGSWGYSSSQKYLGVQSLYITRTANDTTYRIRSTSDSYFTIKAGETYTLSAYVKTTGMSNAGGGAMIAIGSTSEGILSQSKAIKVNSDWTRLELSYTRNANAGDTTGYVCLSNSTVGTAYFDCVQIEKSASASRYNIIENGDFTYAGSSSTDSYAWLEGDGCTTTENRTTYSLGTAAPQLDSYVYSVTGTYDIAKRAYQNIPISGSAGDVYTIAGWAKGDSVPLSSTDRRFGIIVRFYNTDNTTSETIMDFNADARSSIDWQYAAERVVAPKNYTSMRVLIVYEHNANVVYFDGIQLFKEEFGHSYVYDTNGNVISVTDLQKQTTTYEYDTNSRLVKMTLSTGASQSYTYDTYGNVLTSTSPEGVVSTFTYDTYGNNTQVTIGSGTQKVTTSATYTSNNNQLHKITDARGNVTEYSYDANTGVLNWVKAPGETDSTRTNYSYDSLYRTTQVSKADTTNTYTYTDDLLTGSTSAGNTTYTYSYGVFDLISSVKVGDHTLISHTYSNDQNRYLTKSTYGNDDYITYSYDELGRTTGIGYEDNANAIQYKYNNDGELGVVIDNMNGITTKYYYDMQGRMMGYDETGADYTNSVEWGYDEQNNLNTQKHTINNTEYVENYTYDDDNRITQIAAGSVVSAYAYDAYSRISTITNKYNGNNVVTTSIGYLNPSSTTTTSLVNTWTTTTPNYSKTYTYAYDNRGNITSISDGTYTTSYTYDQYDQLTRENNQKAGKTWVYTYDTAGNILTKDEYAYTTGTLGTPTNTINYSYKDNSWDELLTGYNDNTNYAFMYDNIGNLTYANTDSSASYDWEHGRQLSHYSSGSATHKYHSYYEYDAEGRRINRNSDLDGDIHYYYTGDTLTHMTVKEFSDVTTLHFTYDTTGVASVNYDGTEYYYLKNAQGDITGITDSSGNLVVEYTYDAWGNVISTTGSLMSSLGMDNPFLYRGYVYDRHSELYYLQSRYYDPSLGRFISADGFISMNNDTIGCNLFAYCGNNPINRKDSTGYSYESFITVFGNEFQNAKNALQDILNALGELSAVDGPYPFGDAAAVVAVALIAVGTAGYATYRAIKTTRQTKERDETAEKVATQNVYQYWVADRVKNQVVVGRGLTLIEACDRVAMGGSIMCANQGAALWILVLNGYVTAVGPEIHGEEGFYWHYHPHRHTHTHIWYY